MKKSMERTTEIDRSECTVIHEEVIETVRESMPADELIIKLADTYKVFSDATRLRILFALGEEEMCVCDIATLLGMTMSAVSHQLRILKQTNLVKNRRDGKTVYYSIADSHVETILSNGMEHILE